MSEQQRRRVFYIKPDPVGDPRNPFQVYLLLLGIVSGTGTTFFDRNTGGLDALIPRAYEITWGALLATGCLFTLLGMFWQGDDRNGLTIKKIGLFTLIVVTLVYAVALLVSFGMQAFLVSFTVLGFSAAAFSQFRRTNRYINQILRNTESEDAG